MAMFSHPRLILVECIGPHLQDMYCTAGEMAPSARQNGPLARQTAPAHGWQCKTTISSGSSEKHIYIA